MKINIYGVDKKKKHKVNKKKTIAGILVAITLVNPITIETAMDTINAKNYMKESSHQHQTVQEIDYGYEYDESVSEETNERKPNNKQLSMSEVEDNIFDTYLDNNQPQYDYEKYYQIDKAVDKETNYKEKNHEHNAMIELVDDKFDADIISKTILTNNKKYMDNISSTSINKYAYEELSTTEINEVANIIAKSLNYELQQNKYIDINELRCVVGNLKVFNSSGIGNAYVDAETGCMVLSPNMIKVSGIMNDKGENNWEDVITHESKHLCQIPCKDNYEEEYTTLGISKEWSDLEVNPLAWRWFYEGSAEKTMMNQTERGAITYNHLVSYIDSLNLATILNDDSSMSVEEIGLQSDSELLYEKFNCQNQQEKDEIIKMMYSIDIIQFDKEDFNKQIGELSEDEINVLDRNLKKGICSTLTRNFYDDLSNKLKNSSMKTDDIFQLISVFEGDINSHMQLKKVERYEQNKEFMDYYINLQDNFFECLATSNDISPEELKEDFLSYTPQDNYEYDSLNKEQNKFLNRRYNEIKSDANKSIKEIKDNYKDKNKQL